MFFESTVKLREKSNVIKTQKKSINLANIYCKFQEKNQKMNWHIQKSIRENNLSE